MQELLGLSTLHFEFALAFGLLHQKRIVIDRAHCARIPLGLAEGVFLLALIMACEQELFGFQCRLEWGSIWIERRNNIVQEFG